MTIKVHYEDGRHWQTDGERRVALWPQATCRQRIARCVETAPSGVKECAQHFEDFWDKALEYVKSKDKEDSFTQIEACNNYYLLAWEWDTYFGGKSELVFIC